MAVIRPFGGKAPRLHETVFVTDGVAVIGDVEVGEASSLWFGAVLRGDVQAIRIGARTSIQDNCVVHVSHDAPAVVEDDVTVGHQATLHGCTVHSRCLIGMGATVLDGAEVGPDAIVGAGALVPPGMRVPPGKMVLGTPARVVRDLTPEEIAGLRETAQHYVGYVAAYRREGWPGK